jgi:hypothetical protein
MPPMMVVGWRLGTDVIGSAGVREVDAAVVPALGAVVPLAVVGALPPGTGGTGTSVGGATPCNVLGLRRVCSAR